MANWTVLGKPNDGGKSFGVTLDTDKNTWLVGGPGAQDAFKTKSGPYAVKPAPALETVLMGSGNAVVANFRKLHGGSSKGDTSTGYQQETAIDFKWTLDSK
jgi:hypothetical protein